MGSTPECRTPSWWDGSSWIGTPLEGTGLIAPPSPMLRRRFELDAAPKQARLHITALGLYEPWLNGQRVGDLELQPGWTDYAKRVHFQTYDVTDLLVAGANTLGAFLGDGWYSGQVAGFERGVLWGSRPLLRAALVMTDADGTTTTLATDDRWQWHAGPIISADLLGGEHYDARKEIVGWCDAHAASDDDWRAVALLQPATEPRAVHESPAPPVRVIETLQPVDEPLYHRGGGAWSRVTWIYDFGQNFTGKVRLHVKGPAGMTLRLKFAEVLKPDGKHLDCSNLRSAQCTDGYTLKGDPAGETWTPRFTFHGFRYAEVSCANRWRDAIEPLTRDSLVGLVMHNDMTRIGSFEVGHELVNRLQQNIVWGQRSNFLEVPTDCPQRDERLGWTGDAQVFAPTAAFNYDVCGFFNKWCNDLDDAQTDDGKMPVVAPNIREDRDAGAGWSDAVVIVPWSTYRACGDRAILEKHYPTMKRWADYQTATAVDGVRGDKDHGIFHGHGDWLALDHNSSNPWDNATPLSCVGTAYHACSQDLFAHIAELLGKTDDAAEARAARQRAVDAFNRLFVKDGRVTVHSQTAHLFALAFDLLDEAHRPGVFDDLLKLLDERDGHLCTGFLGTPLWCDVLTRFGRVDKAYDLLLVETFPGWLYPVTRGATTMWERWNSWHPEQGFVETGMNSLNHYAYGAVGDWMYRTVAGIDLDMSGPSLQLAPHPDPRLGHCRAALDSPLGRIESSWRYDGDQVHYELIVPEGIEATHTRPGVEATTLQPGRHTFTQ